MKLHIKSNGQILQDSPEINLPKFTVITGENGSGKTQLLTWISKSPLIPSPIDHNTYLPLITKDDGQRYISPTYLPPGINSQFNSYNNSEQLLNTLSNTWENLTYVVNICGNYRDISEDNFREKLEDVNRFIISISGQVKINQSNPLIGNNSASIAPRIVEMHELGQVFQLVKKSGKHAKELTFTDFVIFYEINPSLISPYIDLLFHQYQLKSKYYPDEVANLKPPLDIMNEIFESAGFKYKVAYNYSGNENMLNPVQLTDINTGNTITFEGLSSGEKTILSLTFTLYNSSVNGSFPDLMLFDEPDAFLHPSMVKLYIDVVKNVLVKKNRVDVIMTTHSPSTVAIAPEESVYYMKRDIGYPVKIAKGEAINSLIYGINGLFVSYANRRQVFVESDYDVEYYEHLYILLKEMLNKDVQLNFISSGMSKIDKNGNRIATCERVNEITRTFRKYENKHVFGIVDWDLKNSCNDAVTILGEGKRYSIENYLLEPLLIGLMLERESFLTFKEMGIEGKTYTDLKSFTQEDFQKISDFIILKLIDIGKNVPDIPENEEFESTLINGITLKIPKWFVNIQGHLLEKEIINKLPKLNEIKRAKEIGLKLAIIDKLLKDTPTIASIDFLKMFQLLHS